MNRVEVRDLEYVLAVAEALHFARAAEKLGIAPPPLSRAIARLERRLGTTLFLRTSRSVELTPAGRVLQTEARTTLRALDRAISRTRQTGRGALRIATPPGTGAGMLRTLVRAYTARHGRDSIDLVFTRDQATAVRDGRADLALICSAEDLTGLDLHLVTTEQPVALVPVDHPYAARTVLTPACLHRDPAFTTAPPPLGLDALVDLVATGRLVTVVGSSAVDRLGPHVTAVPVTGLPPSEILLAWPTGTPDPRITTLLALADETSPPTALLEAVHDLTGATG